MYKVFISDRPLIFSENEDLLREEIIKDSGYDINDLDAVVKKLETGGIDKAVFLGNEKELWERFISGYKLLEAAGGVVRNTESEILFIWRLGKWDLPKGKIEKGESKKEAATREVEEECGISDLQIIRELTPTYHTYELKGKKILKRTYWFEMLTESKETLTPQIEEHIEKVVWVSPDDISEQLANTYNSIREVLAET